MAQKRQFLRRLLIETGFLLSVFALGMGITAISVQDWMPSLSGQTDMLCAEGETLFLAVSSRRSNYLVGTDTAGKLHSCVRLAGNQAFRAAVPGEAQVFAVLDTEEDGVLYQALVSIPRRDGIVREKVILRRFPQAETEIIWSGLAFSGDSQILYLTGIDELGQGWQMTCTLSGECTEPQRVLTGETLYRLRPAENGDLVWIGQNRQVGRISGSTRQGRLLQGLAETPQEICFSGNCCFISDSISGSIYEVKPDGAARLYCSGTEEVGGSGYPYRQMGRPAVVSSEDGRVHIVGVLRTRNGSMAAGRSFCFDRLEGFRLPLLWAHGWPLAVLCWLVLRPVAALLAAVFCSHRLAVRLCAGELLICLALMGVLTAVQYPVFRASLHGNVLQTLRLMGNSLARTLELVDTAAGEAALDAVVPSAVIVPDDRDYEITVFWQTAHGAVVGYDEVVPFGYLAGDVRPQAYADAVVSCLENQVSGFDTVRSGTHSEAVYVEPFSMCGTVGCIAVSQCMQSLEAEQWKFLFRVFPVLVFGLALMGALVLLTRRLLWPLDSLREGLEAFYACGGGNQVVLDGMPRTELYEIGRVFNQLSMETRRQFDVLSHINGAYARLVPKSLLRLLHRQDVLELSPGDCSAVDGALLLLLPAEPPQDGAALQAFAASAVRQAAPEGLLTAYDESTGALTVIFRHAEEAVCCARGCADSMQRYAALTAVLYEPVTVGVFGADEQLIPMLFSSKLARRLAAVARLRTFGAVLVQNRPASGLRLLGRDQECTYYEDPAYRPSDWQGQWRDAAPYWERAMEHFFARDFVGAMRRFARVLRMIPLDRATRWYLLRCEALRSGACQPDTGLLYDWGDGDG